MLKNNFIFCFLLFYIDCNSQTVSDKIAINYVHKFVYLIEIGKKIANDDSTYSFPVSDNFQIASKKKLSTDNLLEVLKKKVNDHKLDDSAYIDSGSLILDYVKHNDPEVYKQLKPIQEKAAVIKYKSDNGKSYHIKVNDIEFSYSISSVEGDWAELILDKELAQAILGRTILLFNANARRYYLYVLTKQQNAYHITDL